MDIVYTFSVASDSPLVADCASRPRSVWLSRRGLHSVSPTNSFAGGKMKTSLPNEIISIENILCILYTLASLRVLLSQVHW
jgi:hypothetical protein